MEKILDVKNLRISFRTNSGRLKAVRDISFELNKGETIAIVGESGSGKSVTARAIMGILAPNAIVEGGEILYDGMDLMKISEEDFHELRGNRISMIFQDPLSSLNPIVKIGKQLTEAMILNGKATQKDAKKIYERTLKLLEESILAAYANAPEKAAGVKGKVETLKKFIAASNKFEQAYNIAFERLEACVADVNFLKISILENKYTEVVKRTEELCDNALKARNPFLVTEQDAEYASLVEQIVAENKKYATEHGGKQLSELFEQLKNRLETEKEKETPNFFRLGYYLEMVNGAKSVEELAKDTAAMNRLTIEHLDKEFMQEFLKDVAAGLKYSNERSAECKKKVVVSAHKMLELLGKEEINETELKTGSAALIKEVEESIDKLAIIKDSTAYTFKTAMKSAVDNYLHAMKLKNKKFLTKSEKAALANADFELLVKNMEIVVTRLVEDYEKATDAESVDYAKAAVAMIDYLKEYSARMVYAVTKTMAKNRAIQLMEEVGIPEARKRYNQYPFEFSGGMRQRIVIAIALSANPDIIICDEPTTALDVTIQSQILELINNLKETRKLSVVFITHDLGVVANMADKIAVMYAGKVVEYGTVDEIFYEPKHPYTWALLSSMPDIYTEEALEAIPGTPPNLVDPPVGDAFAARNKYALKIDYEQQPPMFKVSDTHYAATWLLHPGAPKVEPPKIVTERIARMKKLEAGANE